MCKNIYDTFKNLITLKQENVSLRGKLDNKNKNKKGFVINYSDKEITITYNGEYQNDSALKKVISGAMSEYQESNERQKKKWREEWDDEFLNGKW